MMKRGFWGGEQNFYRKFYLKDHLKCSFSCTGMFILSIINFNGENHIGMVRDVNGTERAKILISPMPMACTIKGLR